MWLLISYFFLEEEGSYCGVWFACICYRLRVVLSTGGFVLWYARQCVWFLFSVGWFCVVCFIVVV